MIIIDRGYKCYISW